jgi:ABC-2 type transport system permease protein
MRVLSYFKGITGLEDILTYKLLAMTLTTLLALLVFSSLLSTLSKLYLARDLDLVHALPVSRERLFFARWTESTLDSAWMVVLYTLPIFTAYGLVFQADLGYYLGVFLSLGALAVIAAALSALAVMLVVLLVPAGRLRGIFVFLGLGVFLLLYIALRMLRPERLVDPDVFASSLLYLQSMQTPASPLLPSTWAYDGLQALLTGRSAEGAFHLALLAAGAAFSACAATLAAKRIYYPGFNRSRVAAQKLIRAPRRVLPSLPWFSGPTRALIEKELKTFFRDHTQWSQIFLIAALIFIYVYNFKVLPLERSPMPTVYLQNLLAFLNMGLTAFVLIAVTARFAYPAVSMERDAFWIIQAGPISLRRFLWIKYLVYFLPLALLAEILIVTTNIMLQVTPLMMALSVITLLALVPGVVALGIGLGAAYPDFKSENPVQTVTGLGGLTFMILAALLVGAVILLESGPIYHLFMAQLKGRPLGMWHWIWIWGAFTAAALICLGALLLPMQYGIRRLTRAYR